MTAVARLRRTLAPLLVAGMVLAACGGDDTEPGADADTTATVGESDDTGMSDGATDEMTDDMSEQMTDGDHGGSEDATGEATSGEATSGEATSEAAGSAAPDVTATTPDGTTISLADYAGTQVFVETFATWCGNCRRQLGDTSVAAAQAGDGVEFLALSVETDLDPAQLTAYAQDNGFDSVTFAVLDDVSLATLAETFGNAVLVPPSTPKFTVAPDGSVGSLTTGFESTDEILAQIDGDA